MAVEVGLHRHLETMAVVQVTYDPASIALATTAEQTLTVNGLEVGDFVYLQKPTLTAGVGIVNCRVSAANTLAIQWVNATGASVNPVSEVYRLYWIRFPSPVASLVGLA